MTVKKKPLLIEAHDVINGARREMYGDAANGMQGVADQWTLYLRQKYGADNRDGFSIQLTAEDACWMMADVKKFRQMHKSRRDNVLDAAGYIGLIEQVV